MICVGYVGVEAFDIILYIGRTLTTLNYPVLIVDLSETGALTKAIYHGMEMDSLEDIIHYRNINYIRKVPKDSELKDYSKGVVFIVYGHNYKENLPLKMNYLNIITDPYPSNIDKINQVLCSADVVNIKLSILVRNIITIDDFDRVKGSLTYLQDHANTRYVYHDIYDYENALRCQTSQVISFRRISSGMKKIIISEISKMLPFIKPSIIQKAFYCAGKGVT
ncbi:MAG: hypothetical protein EWM47_05620 [Anaerolineaceae bacterium]|nr:MAG: hypothetical protein EWM47_05620 [Anaerolineaceae bacterium]